MIANYNTETEGRFQKDSPQIIILIMASFFFFEFHFEISLLLSINLTQLNKVLEMLNVFTKVLSTAVN